MPLHSKRVQSIIAEECKNAPNRFKSYHKELLLTLADVIQLEHNHRVQGTNVRQKIGDKIAALGQLISKADS